MNAVHKSLRQIVLTYGNRFAVSAELCDAFLSDLMPEYPQERQLLIQGVTTQLTHRILKIDQQLPNEADIQAQFASPAEYQWVEQTWQYALTGQSQAIPHTPTHPLPAPKPLSLILGGGLLASFVGLLIFLWQSDLPLAHYIEPIQLSQRPETDTSSRSTSQPPPPKPIETLAIADRPAATDTTSLEATPQKEEELLVKEATLLIQESVLTAVTLTRENLFAHKKESDIASLDELSQLTDDDFYKQKRQTAQAEWHKINNKIERLTTRYVDNVEKICYLHPQLLKRALQTVALNYSSSSEIEQRAYRELRQHLGSCQAFDDKTRTQQLKILSLKHKATNKPSPSLPQQQEHEQDEQ